MLYYSCLKNDANCWFNVLILNKIIKMSLNLKH